MLGKGELMFARSVGNAHIGFEDKAAVKEGWSGSRLGS